MLHSSDTELSRLGLIMLEDELKSYDDYKSLKGLSIKGKSFFPWHLRKERIILGRKLRSLSEIYPIREQKREESYLKNKNKHKN